MVRGSVPARGCDGAQELSSPSAMAKRNGQWVELAVKDLVMGDVVQLKGGDIIPADCRVPPPPPPLQPCASY